MENVSFTSEVFESTTRGKILQSLEMIIVSGVLASFLYFIFLKSMLSLSGPIGLSFFSLTFVLSMCVFVIAQMLLPRPSLVIKLFPPSEEEISSYRANRLKDLYEELKQEEKYYINRVHSIKKEIQELQQT